MSGESVECLSPLCEERFVPSGGRKPKLYCSKRCIMDVYALRRVAKLYGLEVEAVHEALTSLISHER